MVNELFISVVGGLFACVLYDGLKAVMRRLR